MRGNENYINELPDDAAEMTDLVRRANLNVAIRLMQVWGATQRDIGAIKAIETVKEKLV